MGELFHERTALVTGAGGFVGGHLVEALVRQSRWRIVELVRRAGEDPADPRRRRVVVDIRDEERLYGILDREAPNYIFHLAAAMPPAATAEIFTVNVGGTVALLEAVAKTCPRATVLIVGSDAQYGWQGPARLPTPESAPMRPVGPYGRSKVLQEIAARQFGAMSGLRIICVRPFNLIGPRQSDRFVVSGIARQISLAEHGLSANVVELGDGEAVRDFTDVRDAVDAYLRLVLQTRPGTVYNVGSGVPRRISDLAEALSSAARKPVTFRSVAERKRSGQVTVTHCDSSRLRKSTGWKPRTPIEQTLRDTLDYWRTVVATGSLVAGAPTRSG